MTTSLLAACTMPYGLEVKITSVRKVAVLTSNSLTEPLGAHLGDSFRNNDTALIVSLDTWSKSFALERAVDVADTGLGMGPMLSGKTDVHSNDSIPYQSRSGCLTDSMRRTNSGSTVRQN